MTKRLPEPPADTPTYDEIEACIAAIQPETAARWGVMSNVQMCRHCRAFIRLYLGELPVSLPVRILSRLIGRIFLKKVLQKSPTQTPKNMQTLPSIRMRDDASDLDTERAALLDALATIRKLEGIVDHPLYGKMHAEDIHALVRHHTAHHLNQFGLLQPSAASAD